MREHLKLSRLSNRRVSSQVDALLLEKAAAKLSAENAGLERYPALAKRAKKIEGLLATMERQDEMLDVFRRQFHNEDDYLKQVKRCLDGDFKKIRPLSRTELLFDLRRTLNRISSFRLTEAKKRMETKLEQKLVQVSADGGISMHDLTQDFGPDHEDQNSLGRAQEALSYIHDTEQRLAALCQAQRQKADMAQTFIEEKAECHREVECKAEELRKRRLNNLRTENIIESLNKELDVYTTQLNKRNAALAEEGQLVKAAAAEVAAFLKDMEGKNFLTYMTAGKEKLQEVCSIYRALRRHNNVKENEVGEWQGLANNCRLQINKYQSDFSKYCDLSASDESQEQLHNKYQEMAQQHAVLAQKLLKLEQERDILVAKKALWWEEDNKGSQKLDFDSIKKIKRLTELQKTIARKSATLKLIKERKAMAVEGNSDITFTSIDSITMGDI